MRLAKGNGNRAKRNKQKRKRVIHDVRFLKSSAWPLAVVLFCCFSAWGFSVSSEAAVGGGTCLRSLEGRDGGGGGWEVGGGLQHSRQAASQKKRKNIYNTKQNQYNTISSQFHREKKKYLSLFIFVQESRRCL